MRLVFQVIAYSDIAQRDAGTESVTGTLPDDQKPLKSLLRINAKDELCTGGCKNMKPIISILKSSTAIDSHRMVFSKSILRHVAIGAAVKLPRFLFRNDLLPCYTYQLKRHCPSLDVCTNCDNNLSCRQSCCWDAQQPVLHAKVSNPLEIISSVEVMISSSIVLGRYKCAHIL